jgi:chromosome partitioning protein
VINAYRYLQKERNDSIFIAYPTRMTKIISFISRKGGTGKTTSAINLATILFNLGHKLVLIETDTNYTLSTLRKMELFKTKANENTIFPIIGSDDEKALEDIDELLKGAKPDFIIVDSAGKTTTEAIKKLCLMSDIVIIPTSLSQNDMLVTYQTIEDLKPAKGLKDSLKILVLPNRIHSLTRKNTVQASLEELDGIILNSIVTQKNAFANFSTILPEKEFLPVATEIVSHL